jgi:predicted transcriptional regulator
MKAKTLKIVIKPEEQFYAEGRRAMKATLSGKKPPRRETLSFTSLEAMRKMLTEERLRLLHAIKTHTPQSVAELAELLGRDYKNVSEDVALLSELGLIELTSPRGQKSAAKGGRKAPRLCYSAIECAISL